MSMEDPHSVSQTFECFKYLQTLNLRGKRNLNNNLRRLSVLGMSLLGSGLKDCVNLKVLILRSNGIGDISTNELVKGLHYCNNLEELDLHELPNMVQQH